MFNVKLLMKMMSISDLKTSRLKYFFNVQMMLMQTLNESPDKSDSFVFEMEPRQILLWRHINNVIATFFGQTFSIVPESYYTKALFQASTTRCWRNYSCWLWSLWMAALLWNNGKFLLTTAKPYFSHNKNWSNLTPFLS